MENYTYTIGQKEMITFEKHCTYHFIVSGNNWLWINKPVNPSKVQNVLTVLGEAFIWYLLFLLSAIRQCRKLWYHYWINALNLTSKSNWEIFLAEKNHPEKDNLSNILVENTIWRSKSVQIRMIWKNAKFPIDLLRYLNGTNTMLSISYEVCLFIRLKVLRSSSWEVNNLRSSWVVSKQ